MSPTLDGLFRLFHVLAVGLFAGSLVSMVVVQGLLGRATQDPERRHLAGVAARIARQITGPLILGGWLIGVVYWIVKFSPLHGVSKLMACTPIYVHTMLLFGTLSLGAAQAWKKKTRQVAEVLDTGSWTAEGQGYLRVGNITAGVALATLLLAWTVASLKVPNPTLSNCKAPEEAALSAPVVNDGELATVLPHGR